MSMDEKKLDEMLSRQNVPAFDPQRALDGALGQISKIENGENIVSFPADPKRSRRVFIHSGAMFAAVAACLLLMVNVSRPVVQESGAYAAVEGLESQYEALGAEIVGMEEIFAMAEIEVESEDNLEMFDMIIDGDVIVDDVFVF